MFGPSTKVLVVDDFKTMRRIVINALAQINLTNITECEDAADAWPLVEQAAKTNEPFQLIISDWNMPKMQGIEFLRRVRSYPLTQNLPFILVTAEAEQKNIIEALNLKVSNYIVKPFSPVLMAEKIMGAYQKHSKAA